MKKQHLQRKLLALRSAIHGMSKKTKAIAMSRLSKRPLLQLRQTGKSLLNDLMFANDIHIAYSDDIIYPATKYAHRLPEYKK